jgi:hypothetical protein
LSGSIGRANRRVASSHTNRAPARTRARPGASLDLETYGYERILKNNPSAVAAAHT